MSVVARDIVAAKMTVAAPAPGTPARTTLFGTSVYIRGALTLCALRQSVGDQTFFAIPRTYIERFRRGTASTSDFIAVASRATGT
jgi:aminopeptidase N